MLCLEVLLDGQVISRAGEEDLSLLDATLHLLPKIKMQRLIVSGHLENDAYARTQRWLDMSLLEGSLVSFRIVESSSPEVPLMVAEFGTFPGDKEPEYFCSFCGASGSEGTPLMNGPAGNICPNCVRNFLSWAQEHSSDS
jgi:ClpX C4-type zinc finger protein